MADAQNDKWLDLIERFVARGAQISVGNLAPCMIRHLLDTVEEQDVRIRGIEDGYRKLKAAQREADDKDSY